MSKQRLKAPELGTMRGPMNIPIDFNNACLNWQKAVSE